MHHMVKRPKLTSILTGRAWIQELCNGHPDRFYEQFGMYKPVFLRLLQELTSTGCLYNTRLVSATERLAIFLYFVRHGDVTRNLIERFQRSGTVISQ
ncbi:hypothetical protein EV360DRAFT_55282 [Lentinula raphanica]|nr:hypothetical protein EV360DRAFT_55282 [Lentinula raphanica]